MRASVTLGERDRMPKVVRDRDVRQTRSSLSILAFFLLG